MAKFQRQRDHNWKSNSGAAQGRPLHDVSKMKYLSPPLSPGEESLLLEFLAKNRSPSGQLEIKYEDVEKLAARLVKGDASIERAKRIGELLPELFLEYKWKLPLTDLQKSQRQAQKVELKVRSCLEKNYFDEAQRLLTTNKDILADDARRSLEYGMKARQEIISLLRDGGQKVDADKRAEDPYLSEDVRMGLKQMIERLLKVRDARQSSWRR